jgi:hypothetical protein
MRGTGWGRKEVSRKCAEICVCPHSRAQESLPSAFMQIAVSVRGGFQGCRWLLPMCTTAIFAVFAANSPLANAKTSHVYLSVIPTTEVPSGRMVEATSITVHSGDLYVAESLESGSSESRTDEYAPSVANPSKYELVSTLKEPSQEIELDRGIAFGTEAGETEMYIGKQRNPVGVDVFDVGRCDGLECASLQEKWTGMEAPKPFNGRITDVAVDNSSSAGDWASGDVFVDEAFGDVIDVFEPQAGGKEKYVTDVTGISPTKHFGEPTSIAVSGYNGDLLVGEGSSVYLFRPEEEGKKRGKYEFIERLVPPSGAFGTVEALAVDDSTEELYKGEIYVATPTAIYEFGPEGSPRGEITGIPKEGAPAGVEGEKEEVQFNNDTARPRSIAVDPASHQLFVGVFGSEVSADHENEAVVDVFSPDVVIPEVETEEPVGLELETDGGTGIHSWGILPTGTVDSDEAGVASCWFVWGTSSSFGQMASCEPPTVPSGGSPGTRVDASLSGLEPDTPYFYRLQAKNANGTNPGEEQQNYAFTTPGPGLRSEAASDVSSSSATLDATIAPHDAPIEGHDFQAVTKSPTSYYFQYSKQSTDGCASDPSGCTNVPLSAVSVGSGAAGVEVSQHLQGLMPGTTYHYRVVAANEALANEALAQYKPGVLVSFYGPDQTFTTQGPGAPLVLPDGRAWELVSPVDKHGATIQPISEAGIVQAATGGGAFTYLTSSPAGSEPRGYGAIAQVLSSRGAKGGWSSTDLALSHSAPVGVLAGAGQEYRFFSEDLGLGVAESFGPFSVPEGWYLNEHNEPRHIVEAFPMPTERTPYLRHNSTCVAERGTCYEPFLTKEDVTSKEAFGGSPEVAEGEASFVGATPGAGNVVISSKVGLTAGHGGGLYEWSADKPGPERLSFVSLSPEDEGGQATQGARFGDAGINVNVARRMISADGSRVFFSGVASNQNREHLYMRDMVKGGTGETVRLDVAENGSPTSQPAIFQIANRNGSKAFFTDSAHLTKNAGTSGSDLYECEILEEAGKPLRCEPSDLTPVPALGRPGAGESADVLGVLGASEDGDYVYFVAGGVLAAGTSPGDNLYVAHEEAGKWTTNFVANLSGDDSPDWSFTLSKMTARVSPDGLWLAFMSDRSLTGYDNRDAKSGMPDEEVYLYSAATGKVVCSSCDPSGARPVGVEYKKLSDRLVGGDRVWPEGQWLAANVPAWTPYRLEFALYQSRYLSDSGRLFFNSSDALVPQDTNGNEDVYEYEPSGVGSCTSLSATFSAGSGGCVGLISSGVAFGESAFLDASETGGDVFFLTKERLVSQDVDTALDVYDAHECVADSSCPSQSPPPKEECGSAASCRAAPATQPSLYGAPSSATFSGTGNVASSVRPAEKPAEKPKPLTRAQKLARALGVCRKDRSKHKRVECERLARRRYGPVKSSKASAGRSSVKRFSKARNDRVGG